jgi:hypothetical protein
MRTLHFPLVMRVSDTADIPDKMDHADVESRLKQGQGLYRPLTRIHDVGRARLGRDSRIELRVTRTVPGNIRAECAPGKRHYQQAWQMALARDVALQAADCRDAVIIPTLEDAFANLVPEWAVGESAAATTPLPAGRSPAEQVD